MVRDQKAVVSDVRHEDEPFSNSSRPNIIQA